MSPQIIPCQVLKKVEVARETEKVETVKKPKEAIARGKCWKGSLLRILKIAGEPFSWDYVLAGFRLAGPRWNLKLMHCDPKTSLTRGTEKMCRLG